ncbi:MAG TPA: tRNA preQ1(34) S-adenosylmethionine ribosyltransferase-isomerase QueA [Prochlorococcaceae cyanobacterium AMR_MDS_5431]|nr:tRNA preQ1(34) S-adenosylmethionine ribosyltransferase-isomerase QueA [Prochlorococcaceae cyanobacterium AMR_MDS_5431]
MIYNDFDTKLSSYDFFLPREHISQIPVEPRHNARMLIVPLLGEKSNHARVWDLIDQLKPNDLLIVNDTKVLCARLMTRSLTGSRGELLLLEPRGNGQWLCIGKPSKFLYPGNQIGLEKQGQPLLWLKVLEIDNITGGRIIQFPYNFADPVSIQPLLSLYGDIPLPPYILPHESVKSERYQTRYATKLGAAAAPTAGLHFSDELLEALQRKQVNIANITLHVGLGTFRPLTTENLNGLKIHSEWVEVPPKTVDAINACRASKGRVIAIGTTSVRALEGSSQLHGGKLQPFSGYIEIVIKPGYQFNVIDGLLTNFHFPKSSLLLLVSALIGRKNLLSLYQEAIGLGYRFFSYGDAMWIPPQAIINYRKNRNE